MLIHPDAGSGATIRAQPALTTTKNKRQTVLPGARREVRTRYGARPTQFILGDFVAIADTLPDADVVTLDRVVCCYPDAEALLRSATTRARRVLAFTYPRDRWYVRAMAGLENFLLRLRGKEFRAFVHAPERMATVLKNAASCSTRDVIPSCGCSMFIAEELISRQRPSPERADSPLPGPKRTVSVGEVKELRRRGKGAAR